jgi:hypothetical protein
LIQSPEQLAKFLNESNPGADVKPADILAALAYGTLVEDRFEFDIEIKYRSPKSRKNPAATFTFAGIPVKRSQVKQISMLEKRYGEIKFKEKDNPIDQV